MEGLRSENADSGRRQALLARDKIIRLGQEAPELAPYQDEPAQMPGGSVGKFGFLHLGFARSGKRTILGELNRRAPLLVQKALYWDEALPDMPCVMIITTTGCIVQGDRLALRIHVGLDAQAHVTTQSAAKIHSMDSNYAAQLQEIIIEDGGYLEYIPEPVIPHRGARFLSDTRISIAENGTLFYAEMLLPGRRHHHREEKFGFELYSSRIAAWPMKTEMPKRPFFVEKYVLEPKADDLGRTGVMNGYEVLGSAVLVCAPDTALALCESMGAGVHTQELAFGCALLPGSRGVILKVLGMSNERVHAKIRDFWGLTRKAVTGAALPPPFLWR